ncbi:hypothetical protein BH24ACT3_BH24ACT3_13640 [soil metagenome]
MASQVILTAVEAWDLMESIMDGVAHVEDGAPLPVNWPAEMRDWCDLLIERRLRDD